MKYIIHMSLSVAGALKNWSAQQWYDVAKDNNITVSECKNTFLQYIREGKEVIPFGNDCDNFDYKHGCMKHEVKE